MHIVLFILSVLVFLLGFMIMAAAKSALGEIEAMIMVLISAVLFSSGCLIEAVKGVVRELRSRPTPRDDSRPERLTMPSSSRGVAPAAPMPDNEGWLRKEPGAR